MSAVLTFVGTAYISRVLHLSLPGTTKFDTLASDGDLEDVLIILEYKSKDQSAKATSTLLHQDVKRMALLQHLTHLPFK
ncbi:hypothetical protein L6452_34428 [Arctium lappa]|uniref:Uncharacterized protein n=1 Tax=Arctium lappa TaxID=4217 RepID=A0ACB8YIA7_ARCLA|nr:hypothetical protein L6452_34428 [Arctium lappa]